MIEFLLGFILGFVVCALMCFIVIITNNIVKVNFYCKFPCIF